MAEIIPIRAGIAIDWHADMVAAAEAKARVDQTPYVLAIQGEMQRLVAAAATANWRAGFDAGCWQMLPFIGAAAAVGVLWGWVCAQ